MRRRGANFYPGLFFGFPMLILPCLAFYDSPRIFHKTLIWKCTIWLLPSRFSRPTFRRSGIFNYPGRILIFPMCPEFSIREKKSQGAADFMPVTLAILHTVLMTNAVIWKINGRSLSKRGWGWALPCFTFSQFPLGAVVVTAQKERELCPPRPS